MELSRRFRTPMIRHVCLRRGGNSACGLLLFFLFAR